MTSALYMFLLMVVPTKITFSIAIVKRKLRGSILTLPGKPSNSERWVGTVDSPPLYSKICNHLCKLARRKPTGFCNDWMSLKLLFDTVKSTMRRCR